jgi:hypothetical protein
MTTREAGWAWLVLLGVSGVSPKAVIASHNVARQSSETVMRDAWAMRPQHCRCKEGLLENKEVRAGWIFCNNPPWLMPSLQGEFQPFFLPLWDAAEP